MGCGGGGGETIEKGVMGEGEDSWPGGGGEGGSTQRPSGTLCELLFFPTVHVFTHQVLVTLYVKNR